MVADCSRPGGIEAVAFSAHLDRRQKLLQPIRKLASQAAVFNDLRVLVAGIPNVGKSAVINKLVGRRRAIVGAKPGVTRSQQWIRAGEKPDNSGHTRDSVAQVQ